MHTKGAVRPCSVFFRKGSEESHIPPPYPLREKREGRKRGKGKVVTHTLLVFFSSSCLSFKSIFSWFFLLSRGGKILSIALEHSSPAWAYILASLADIILFMTANFLAFLALGYKEIHSHRSRTGVRVTPTYHTDSPQYRTRTALLQLVE